MDAEEFYTRAQEPEFGDEMIFRLDKENPDGVSTFSHEGIQGITDHIHDFVIARTFARWKETGRPPEKLGIGVTLVFGDEVADPSTQPLPWFSGGEVGTGLTLIDGEHRIPRKHLDR